MHDTMKKPRHEEHSGSWAMTPFTRTAGAGATSGLPEAPFGPRTLFCASHEGPSSPPREPKPNFLFEVCSARTTSDQRPKAA